METRSGEFRGVDATGDGERADPTATFIAIMTGTMMAVRDRSGLVD